MDDRKYTSSKVDKSSQTKEETPVHQQKEEVLVSQKGRCVTVEKVSVSKIKVELQGKRVLVSLQKPTRIHVALTTPRPTL